MLHSKNINPLASKNKKGDSGGGVTLRPLELKLFAAFFVGNKTARGDDCLKYGSLILFTGMDPNNALRRPCSIERGPTGRFFACSRPRHGDEL